jgi:hypothetical protein
MGDKIGWKSEGEAEICAHFRATNVKTFQSKETHGWSSEVDRRQDTRAGGRSPYLMKRLFVLLIATCIPATLNAETGCPANITAIPFHNVNRHEMIVEVSINHSGPYDFLFDTGTQVTVVDQSLASELHLEVKGKAAVAGISFQGPAILSQLDDVELGDHGAINQGVLVYDMKRLQSAGYAIRGLLGADFLSRFDVLINNALKVVCVDDTGAMLQGVIGERTARVAPVGATAKSHRPGSPNRLNAASSAGDD